MSEREYYTNSPYINYCKAKGYDDRIETESGMQRMAAYRIHQSLVQKPLTITEFWPLPSDKGEKSITGFLPPSKEMLAAIKKAHKLK